MALGPWPPGPLGHDSPFHLELARETQLLVAGNLLDARQAHQQPPLGQSEGEEQGYNLAGETIAAKRLALVLTVPGIAAELAGTDCCDGLVR